MKLLPIAALVLSVPALAQPTQRRLDVEAALRASDGERTSATVLQVGGGLGLLVGAVLFTSAQSLALQDAGDSVAASLSTVFGVPRAAADHSRAVGALTASGLMLGLGGLVALMSGIIWRAEAIRHHRLLLDEHQSLTRAELRESMKDARARLWDDVPPVGDAPIDLPPVAPLHTRGPLVPVDPATPAVAP